MLCSVVNRDGSWSWDQSSVGQDVQDQRLSVARSPQQATSGLGPLVPMLATVVTVVTLAVIYLLIRRSLHH